MVSEGARRGVRENGAVNYHKVALEEQRENTKKSSANRRQKKSSANRRQKKKQCQPQAKEEQCQPQAKKTVQQLAEVSSECTRTKRSASSPSTKGGRERSVIWLRERNKVIEEK